MNINLVADSSNAKEAPPDHQNISIADIENIPLNICSSFIINETLNALTNQQLEMILTKIRHGGTISINSPDAVKVSRALYIGDIDISQFASLMINTQSQHSILDIKTFFVQRGYNIEIANINGLSFYIRVKRP